MKTSYMDSAFSGPYMTGYHHKVYVEDNTLLQDFLHSLFASFKMKFLLTVFCFAATFYASDALKCWQGYSPAGPFNTTGLTQPTDCTSGAMWCLKEMMTGGHQRSCVPTPPQNDQGVVVQTASCYNGPRDNSGNVRQYCICNTDGCNSSSALGFSVVLVFLLAAWNLLKIR
uniref:Protein quiver n=1 Tax=Steinernema glaseri TaxID=37863 RepID=A0A1I7ZXR6_9BILA